MNGYRPHRDWLDLVIHVLAAITVVFIALTAAFAAGAAQ